MRLLRLSSFYLKTLYIPLNIHLQTLIFVKEALRIFFVSNISLLNAKTLKQWTSRTGIENLHKNVCDYVQYSCIHSHRIEIEFTKSKI